VKDDGQKGIHHEKKSRAGPVHSLQVRDRITIGKWINKCSTYSWFECTTYFMAYLLRLTSWFEWINECGTYDLLTSDLLTSWFKITYINSFTKEKAEPNRSHNLFIVYQKYLKQRKPACKEPKQQRERMR